MNFSIKNTKIKKTFYIGLSIILFILIWFILSNNFDFNLIFPSPLDTLKSLVELFNEKHTYIILGLTILRIFISLLIGLIIGAVLGIFSGLWKRLEYFFIFIVSMLRSIPVASIIIIVLIYFGNSKTPYIISFLMIFPIAYQGFINSFKRVKKEYGESYILESGFNLYILFKIYFPLMLEDIKSIVIQIAGLAIKVIIAAELICMTPNSIGKEILFAKNDLNYSLVFAWTIILIVLAILLERFRIKKVNK